MLRGRRMFPMDVAEELVEFTSQYQRIRYNTFFFSCTYISYRFTFYKFKSLCSAAESKFYSIKFKNHETLN